MQLSLMAEPRGRGGPRAGAGRKPRVRRRVPHRSRPRLRSNETVHVTLRLRDEAAGLRRKVAYRAIRRALVAAGQKATFRVCQFSVQHNHVHLLCEARSGFWLTRGVQGLATTMPRRLNAARGRRGPVFDGRFHARALRSPREVRNAIAYVLGNWRRHREHCNHPGWVFGPFSSAAFFEGWARAGEQGAAWWRRADEPSPVARARHWLLTTGWQRGGGLLSPFETPGPRR
jgi:putative transposase